MDRPLRALRTNPSRAAKLKAPCRTTRSTAAYFRSYSLSSESDSDLDDDSDDFETSHAPIKHTFPTTRKRKSTSDNYSPPPKKVLRQAHKVVKKASPKTIAPSTPDSNEVTPAASPATPSNTCTFRLPLENLPYHVLLCVFDSIAAPIRDLSSRREDVSEAVGDLMSAARVCKAFLEPALANLYKCPPFYHHWRYTKAPQTSLSQFIDTLNLSPDTTIMNYRPKVEVLQMEVASTLIPRFGTNYLNFQTVVRNLPRLSSMELYHEFDEPPYRKLDEHIRFKCAADDLMQTLAGRKVSDTTVPTQLKSWRWNSRLTSDSLSLDKLAGFHSNSSFASLRKVAFVNYQLASWGLTARQQSSEVIERQNHERIAQLSACISALPDLEHLVLESCTLVNGLLLEQLPTSLKHLEFINCWELTANDLTNFLLSNGSHLQSLTINHCQSLSLTFLPVLEFACPKLQHLYIDLSYFRHHEHYADNKPEYDVLLTENDVPRWPPSIQSIEILHMRKWGRRAAETFFQSLVQSASELPHLRRLALRIALDIGWRQRQEFREFWVDKMARIFKRKTKPRKDIKTVRAPPVKPQRQEQRMELKPKISTSTTLPRRRSTRIANLSPAPTSSEGEPNYLSKAELTRASAISKELKRLRGSGLLLKERDADDEESEDELAADHSDQSQLERKVRKVSRQVSDNEFIHGLCDVVDIQVDNHRPTERQFDMEDFLDSPEESDPDWDGGDADIFD
ncbi:uncharacterized protein F4812DRAFT_413501 [Daldinia caldariorum]|uniref:uncharacterized protein n=1 Tax=Daldinia caldariorum TaxID=326644 RepID=UPI002008A0A6|nr:uncharacterized protein F4812DRAFT_413501 [Daldinia caldariorum]KAI1471307.1 hypothetical protein F4812DRAFT_413501 [Daldinia caldariorum]